MKSNKRAMLAPAEQHLLEIRENVERISDINTWLSDLAVLCSLNNSKFSRVLGLEATALGPSCCRREGEGAASRWEKRLDEKK